MIVLGLDVSTHMGIAVGDAGVLYMSDEFYTPKEDYSHRYERYEQYVQKVRLLVAEYKPAVVVTERMVASKFGAAIIVNEIGAGIRFKLSDLGVPFIEVAPSTLKKFVTGKGNAKKQLMLLHVYKRWGFDTDNDNIADAYALYQMGLAFCGYSEDYPKVNFQAVQTVRKSHDAYYKILGI